jgi:hypothetical protein
LEKEEQEKTVSATITIGWSHFWKKNTFMTHHLLNPQRTINCYFPPMCIALHCFTNVYMTKTHTHTDRVLVEMFHNYTFKECISVEKLRLWLLILTKTLF